MTSILPLQTTQLHVDPAVIGLEIRQPQFSLLPLERIRKAADWHFSLNDANFLQYGAEQGDGYLLRELAGFLTQEYAFLVLPQTLFITNGASSGLDLICSLLTRPGDVIFVEEPSYFLAMQIFADHRLQLVPIPIDEHGLVVEALEDALKKYHPVFLYTIPTFQNPSGRTLSEERRRRLAHFSREHDFLIVADEVYHLLNFGAQPPRPLAAYAETGNIISLGSFSKILAPGLRLGWIPTDPARVRTFVECGLVNSGGGLNPFTSGIILRLIEAHELKENIQALCRSTRPGQPPWMPRCARICPRWFSSLPRRILLLDPAAQWPGCAGLEETRSALPGRLSSGGAVFEPGRIAGLRALMFCLL